MRVYNGDVGLFSTTDAALLSPLLVIIVYFVFSARTRDNYRIRIVRKTRFRWVPVEIRRAAVTSRPAARTERFRQPIGTPSAKTAFTAKQSRRRTCTSRERV